jgi:hypothetical protein
MGADPDARVIDPRCCVDHRPEPCVLRKQLADLGRTRMHHGWSLHSHQMALAAHLFFARTRNIISVPV